MAIDARHLEDSERDQAGKPASLAADGIDPLIKAVQDAHKFEIDTKRLNYTMGTGFEETAKAGLLLANYSKSGGGAGESAEKKAARRAYEEAVLHALQSGDIGNFVADEIFGKMDEAEINDLVTKIEAETGMPFEDYAADILGEDAAVRLDGETLFEYRQRMFAALSDKMLDEDGIKPEYANDPVAQFIQSHWKFQVLMGEIEPQRQLGVHENASDKIVAETNDLADENAAVADDIGHNVANIELKDIATGSQDGHTDGRADAPATQAVNEDGFDDLFLVDGLVSSASKLDSKTITEEFNTANAGPLQGQPPVVVAKADISFEA